MSRKKQTPTAATNPAALSGFLVMLRRRFDDKPLALFATRAAAVEYAGRLVPADGHDGPELEPGCVGRAEDNTLGVVSIALRVGVIPFTSGVPGPVEPVESFVRRRQPLEGTP